MIDHWRRWGREIAASDLIGDHESGGGIDDFFDQAGRRLEVPNADPARMRRWKARGCWHIFEQYLSQLKHVDNTCYRDVRGLLQVSASVY